MKPETPPTATQEQVVIPLTPEQRGDIRRITGQEVGELSLTVEQLEERIAPRLASN